MTMMKSTISVFLFVSIEGNSKLLSESSNWVLRQTCVGHSLQLLLQQISWEQKEWILLQPTRGQRDHSTVEYHSKQTGGTELLFKIDQRQSHQQVGYKRILDKKQNIHRTYTRTTTKYWLKSPTIAILILFTSTIIWSQLVRTRFQSKIKQNRNLSQVFDDSLWWL